MSNHRGTIFVIAIVNLIPATLFKAWAIVNIWALLTVGLGLAAIPFGAAVAAVLITGVVIQTAIDSKEEEKTLGTVIAHLIAYGYMVPGVLWLAALVLQHFI